MRFKGNFLKSELNCAGNLRQQVTLERQLKQDGLSPISLSVLNQML